METERAIKLLNPKLQDPYRILAAKKIQQISNSSNKNRGNQKRRAHIIKSINNKLATEKAMIVRADKGRTIIIINTDEYTRKVQNFLTENNFHTLQKLLQQCNLIINKKKIKTTAKSNNFPDHIITQLKSKTHRTRKNETDTKTNKKWAGFTYYNPTIREVTNLFKHTDLGIAFRNTNTLYQLTKPKPHTHIHKNTIKAACTHSPVTHVDRHILDKLVEM
jgi:hypothetical protein